MIGDWCVKVDGALNVPFGREYAVKKLFFFCPKLHYASSLEQYTYYTSSSYSQRWQHTRWRPWTSYGGYEKYLLISRFWLDFYLVRDLLFLFIFTFLCFYYDCTRNILLLRGLNNETATVRVFFAVSVAIWILLLSFWEYRILRQKVRSIFRKRIFSQPSF